MNYLLNLFLLMCIYFLIKNTNTYRVRCKINNAIHAYNKQRITNGKYLNTDLYFTIESYEKTLFRITDWGYKNIVPKDVFEKIEPYLKSKKEF